MDRPFERVYAWVRRVPRGSVVTYGQISILVDRCLSAAAVGWALRVAPPGLPWHRVVNAQGATSTEREHPGRQRALLEREGIRFDAAGRLDLERHRWQPPSRRATKRSVAPQAAARTPRAPAARKGPPPSRSR